MLAKHGRIAFVVVLGIAVFAHARGYPFSIVDDSTFVVKDPLMEHPLSQGWKGLLTTPSMGYPHTVTVLSFALNRRLTGLDPAAYRTVNFAIHLGNVVLVYLLLLRLGVAATIAASAASLLCLHPLVAEPVCWVIGRKDLLATGFLIGSLLVIAGPRPTDDPAAAAPAGPEALASPERWAIAEALALAAMLSKPSAIVAGGLLFIFIRCVHPWWPWRRVALALAPLALAAVAIAVVGITGLHEQGAMVPRSRADTVIDMVRAGALQTQHLIWPRGLTAEYYRTSGDPSILTMILAMVAVAAVAVWALRRTSPRSVERMALLFIALAYVPVSGILETQHWTADSYVYLPLVGVVMALATIVPRFWPRLAGFPALTVVLAALTYTQADTWAGPRALFEPVVAHYPDEPRPLNRLGFAWLNENNNEAAAARVFIELDESFPDFVYNRGHRAWAYAYVGDFKRADAMIRRCIDLDDAGCATRLFTDLLTGKRKLGTVGPELMADAYRQAAPMLRQTMDAGVLRSIAGWLRDKGLGTLAQQAQMEAADAQAGRLRRPAAGRAPVDTRSGGP